MLNGFINVLKDKGFTSHNVVSAVRRQFPGERVGHLGTLDPLAVGVLPVAVGSYRKLTQHLIKKDKEYLAEFTFGLTTDTLDTDGRVTDEKDASCITAQMVEKEARKFVGRITQTPPLFSAVSVDGRRLYDLAREGIEVAPAPREVWIKKFSLVNWRGGCHPKGLFLIAVSGGTYIRSLAQDLGQNLQVGGTVSYLLRTKAGAFRLKGSFSLGALRRRCAEGRRETLFSDPLEVLKGFPKVGLKPEALCKVRHGKELGFRDFREGEAIFLASGHKLPLIAVTYEGKPPQIPKIAASLRVSGRKILYDRVLI